MRPARGLRGSRGRLARSCPRSPRTPGKRCGTTYPPEAALAVSFPRLDCGRLLMARESARSARLHRMSRTGARLLIRRYRRQRYAKTQALLPGVREPSGLSSSLESPDVHGGRLQLFGRQLTVLCASNLTDALVHEEADQS